MTNYSEHDRDQPTGATAPLLAEFNYLADQPGRPLLHTSDPARSRLRLDPHVCEVRDARSLTGTSLARDGFQLVRHPLPRIDYHDVAMRDGPYLVELQEMVRRTTGAVRVISDTTILRLPGRNAFQTPVLRVHTDYTAQSARRLLEESWDQSMAQEAGLREAAQLVAQALGVSGSASHRPLRVMAINAWRPISWPPHDFPLAFCRPDSIAPGDVRPADFIEEMLGGGAYHGELSMCIHNSDHEWLQYPDMTPDELLLFVGFDFANPDRCGAMHSAFRDPGCPPGSAGRASVEARTFAFFDV